MNTPAYVLVNLALLARGRTRRAVVAIGVGAALPDAGMLAFYGYQRALLRRPESEIWGERYFEPAWQDLFDVFNSIPFALALLAIALSIEKPWLIGLSASLLLHAALDLPLHREDAHRHLFPLADWRFESPVSYWDPRHHGRIFALVEMAAATASAAVLWRRFGERRMRAATLALLGVYVGYGVFAVLAWGPL